MLSAEDMKRRAARAAVEQIRGHDVIGVGSGTTVDAFVEALAEASVALDGAVAASEATAARLRATGIRVIELDDVGGLSICVDGADAADESLRLVKGRGGAFAREKVVASAAERFVCIIDETKAGRTLSDVPVPVEVLPMAAGFVAARLERLGGKPEVRMGFRTDNGNAVLDVLGLPIEYPETLERAIAAVPGVVANGVFALRPADMLLTAHADGKVTMRVR